MIAGSPISSVAGAFICSAIPVAFFADHACFEGGPGHGRWAPAPESVEGGFEDPGADFGGSDDGGDFGEF